MSDNPFTKHPRAVGETYFQHAGQASWYGMKLVLGGLGCFVHAIFPFLCVTTGSETIRSLHRRLTGRADKVNWERHPII